MFGSTLLRATSTPTTIATTISRGRCERLSPPAALARSAPSGRGRSPPFALIGSSRAPSRSRLRSEAAAPPRRGRRPRCPRTGQKPSAPAPAGPPDRGEGGVGLRGDIGPEVRGQLGAPVPLVARQPQQGRSVGAAAAQPGRHGNALLDLHPSRGAPPAAGAKRGQRLGG